jgi:hypothetical protein
MISCLHSLLLHCPQDKSRLTFQSTSVFCSTFTLNALFNPSEIRVCVSTHSAPLPLDPFSIIMATIPPATGAVEATTTTTTAATPTPSGVDAATAQNNQARTIKTPDFKKKCCFNEPGGPWPRYFHLS